MSEPTKEAREAGAKLMDALERGGWIIDRFNPDVLARALDDHAAKWREEAERLKAERGRLRVQRRDLLVRAESAASDLKAAQAQARASGRIEEAALWEDVDEANRALRARVAELEAEVIKRARNALGTTDNP